MKKLIFGALATVLFATTGFAKGGETLVNENLNVVTENQLVSEDTPEDTFTCYITITITDGKGNSKTQTYAETLTVIDGYDNQSHCETYAAIAVGSVRSQLESGRLPFTLSK